ncbi:MAG: (d)CMP kinase [Parachlamydiales bacterium]|jgi:cytidylate kinase
MIITIDGSIATGKSTIARKLAQEIGYIYFDTGAMYRSLACVLMKNHVNLDDAEAIRSFLPFFDFDIKIRHGERCYLVNNEDVTLAIRTPEVTNNVSKVAALPFVREKLVDLQRHLALGVNAVFEGRDMGSVVFPEADLKIYLTGRPEVRAKRRYDELQKKFPELMKDVTLEQCLEEINTRDNYDMKREASPLIKAENAFEVDTSDLSPDEVVFKILEIRDSRKTRHNVNEDIKES